MAFDRVLYDTVRQIILCWQCGRRMECFIILHVRSDGRIPRSKTVASVQKTFAMLVVYEMPDNA